MADPRQSARADDDNIALVDLTEHNTTQTGDPEDPESVLASFRKEWRRELESQGSSPTPLTPSKNRQGQSRSPRPTQGQESRPETNVAKETDRSNVDKGDEEIQPDIESKAAELFNKAVELEQSSRLYEAIQYYRRAMTLVPDIEFRVHQHNMLERSEGYHGTVTETEDHSCEEELQCEELQDLVSSFQHLMAPAQAMCGPQFEQDTPHISCLPPEMLDRIMCWVVGNDLDMRSLEQISQVCHGFYLLARNPEIWHKACLRIWGISCELPGPYGSWREMFIHCPHPRYNGCYISRTTYFRPGDCSFQDQNCQPWHLVHYYRYVRFFTDGTVLMLTTPEEPANVVSHLRPQECRFSQVVRGHYRIHGSNVILLLKKQSREKICNRRKGRRIIGGTTDVAETIFKIEFEIRGVKGRPHWVLAWRNYTISYVKYDSKQNVTDVDVNDSSKFPYLAFSRVKSYSVISDAPLT
ncbi:F-box only protein 9 [Palaemon carinicauda]|uniref:F-box only protein 9 n=1 Tax=Palaemon carinicauda TaxID=392227 RepID=UPI0035B5B94C